MLSNAFARWFRMKDWQLGPSIPADIKKCVVIAAPHTSNWDFVYAMGALKLLDIDVKFLAKKELFKWPLGGALRSMGGISVERGHRSGMVEAIIDTFHAAERLVLLIAAEGTRGKVDKWKSGFYQVAVGAGVPILPAYLDYQKREAGFGPPIFPTGDREHDAQVIRAFYTPIHGRFPEKFNPEAIRF